jgi:DnaJ-class molecular chaperone
MRLQYGHFGFTGALNRPRVEVICRSSRGRKCLYDVLGVSPTSSEDEIKTAFRQQAKQWHPDVNREVGLTATANHAYLHKCM